MTTHTIDLRVNGDAFTLPSDTSEQAPLTRLLDELDLQNARGVAIAINDEVVSRSRWQTHTLHPDDRVEIIRATQGG